MLNKGTEMKYIEPLVKQAQASTRPEEQLEMIVYLLQDALRRIQVLKASKDTQ
jgi:hypothetical protein